MDLPITDSIPKDGPTSESGNMVPVAATMTVSNRRGRPSVYIQGISSLTHETCERMILSKDSVCDVCQKSFKTTSVLVAHMRLHTGQKPFACSAVGCQEMFRTQSERARHLRTHTGIKTHHCPIDGCQTWFTSSSNLKKHQKVKHEGIKCYTCDICFKTFGYLTNFKNHQRSHAGEKPYACSHPGCNARFTEYSTALKHVLYVHAVERLFKCDRCPKSYRSKDGLKYHTQRKHNDADNMKIIHTRNSEQLRSLIVQEIPELASVLSNTSNDIALHFDLEGEAAVLLGFHEESEFEHSVDFHSTENR